jgi:hypothetical protein
LLEDLVPGVRIAPVLLLDVKELAEVALPIREHMPRRQVVEKNVILGAAPKEW